MKKENRGGFLKATKRYGNKVVEFIKDKDKFGEPISLTY